MKSARHHISVHVPSQTLTLRDSHGQILIQTRVATARNGTGERNGSECTPCGRHIIRVKIGGGQPANTVFVARSRAGELYAPKSRTPTAIDLTRILGCPNPARIAWARSIPCAVYHIHGCPDDDPWVPSSHGCIKMRNNEIIALLTWNPVRRSTSSGTTLSPGRSC